MARKDLTGKRFDHLVVIEYAGLQGKSAMWRCKCDCGNEHIVRGNNLTAGAVRSCGCILKDNAYKHGASRTRLYRIWYGIIRRTEDSSRKEFKDYGALGIRMCPEWRNSFETFQCWAMSNGYNDELSIDRIDANGDYEPSNCRWATKTEQECNKRTTKMITVEGVSRSPAEWSQISGIPAYQIRRRIARGWDGKRAVFEPLDSAHQHKQL